jgi:hypothetical protein
LSRNRGSVFRLAAALAVAACLVAAGCAPKGPTFVDAGASYTESTLGQVYAKADTSKLANESAGDTTKLRHDALTSLRGHGTAASSAADLITKTFPPTMRGVPVYVERATYNGEPALVVVEAIGPTAGKLSLKRLWVLSETGTVLFYGTK